MSYHPRLLGLYGKVFAFRFFAHTSLLRRSVCTKTSGKYFNFPERLRSPLISLQNLTHSYERRPYSNKIRILCYVYTLRLIRPISYPADCYLMVRLYKSTASSSHDITYAPRYEIGPINRTDVNVPLINRLPIIVRKLSMGRGDMNLDSNI